MSKLRTMTMICCFYRTVMFTDTISVSPLFQLDVSVSEQDDTEHQDDLSESLQQSQTPLSRPGTPSAGTLHPASPLEWLDEGAVEETPSPAPSTANARGHQNLT